MKKKKTKQKSRTVKKVDLLGIDPCGTREREQKDVFAAPL